MKKILLLSAIGMSALSAMALEDVTPANYMFNNVKEFNYATNAYGTSNIGVPVWETINGAQNFDNGMVVVCGAVAWWGKGAADPLPLVDTKGGPSLIAGTSLVNLGGEVGQVLAISGSKSRVNQRIEDLYGVDLQIPNMTDGVGWFSLNFFTDPNTLNTNGSPDYYNLRCRITCNFYYNFPNGPEDAVSLVNPFLVNDQGGITTTNNAICTDSFIKVNEDEEPIDDDGEVSEENYYWDPNKWMQFELNFPVKAAEDGINYAPVRLKYDIKADPLQNGTMFIKSVEFFVPTEDEAVNQDGPVVNMITLNADPAASGIAKAAIDNNAQVSLNGRTATFGAAANVYSVTGAQVAKVAANQGVALQPGVYVANVDGKCVKFFVK